MTGVIDLTSFSSLAKLKSLNLQRSKIKNPEGILGLERLEKLYLQKTEGIADFSVFKDLPRLKYIYVKGDQYPKEQIEPYGEKAKVEK